eukprot:m.164127 g.164127  ORF g.164127 m.164127 type:complete len:298 (+) comp10312_c0_seq5:4062-4955(+)
MAALPRRAAAQMLPGFADGSLPVSASWRLRVDETVLLAALDGRLDAAGEKQTNTPRDLHDAATAQFSSSASDTNTEDGDELARRALPQLDFDGEMPSDSVISSSSSTNSDFGDEDATEEHAEGAKASDAYDDVEEDDDDEEGDVTTEAEPAADNPPPTDNHDDDDDDKVDAPAPSPGIDVEVQTSFSDERSETKEQAVEPDDVVQSETSVTTRSTCDGNPSSSGQEQQDVPVSRDLEMKDEAANKRAASAPTWSINFSDAEDAPLRASARSQRVDWRAHLRTVASTSCVFLKPGSPP